MILSQQQWLTVILTLVLLIAYLLGKLIEHFSRRPIEKDGKRKYTEGIDMGFYTLVTGFTTFISFVWMLDALHAFSS